MNNYIERLAPVLGALITSLTILSASADERAIIDIPISETDESSEARLLSAFFGLDNKLPFRSNLLKQFSGDIWQFSKVKSIII